MKVALCGTLQLMAENVIAQCKRNPNIIFRQADAQHFAMQMTHNAMEFPLS